MANETVLNLMFSKCKEVLTFKSISRESSNFYEITGELSLLCTDFQVRIQPNLGHS